MAWSQRVTSTEQDEVGHIHWFSRALGALGGRSAAYLGALSHIFQMTRKVENVPATHT